jgi:hypothetical protein
MILLGALSCFQGERAAFAATTLLELGFDGVQLTPGCAPEPALQETLDAANVRYSTHHGYSNVALRRKVWDGTGALASSSDSIHPPRRATAAAFWHLAETDPAALPIIEVMYGSYALGCSQDIARAMRLGLRLAVDVSHLHIQLTEQTSSAASIRSLLEYEHIAEIHLSHNDGTKDAHQPLQRTSYQAAWAKERQGTPVVFEGYMHRLSTKERFEQVELLRELLV